MRLKHWIVFILLGLIWSTSFLWIKIGVREISPMALVALRMSFGAITAVAIAISQKVGVASRLENLGHICHSRTDESGDSGLPDLVGRIDHRFSSRFHSECHRPIVYDCDRAFLAER
jgi:hypothetical protein